MARRRLAALAGALALALGATGCVSAVGRCDVRADCAANERCDGGVCVRTPSVGGNGSEGGADPTSFTPVLWSTLASAAGATFSAESVSADPATGDLVVAGGLAGAYDPWSLGTGGFVARLAGPSGALVFSVRFPTFSQGRLRTAAAPGGGVFFAGTAFDPTDLGTILVPGAAGALVVGRLDASGAPTWAPRAVDDTHPTAPLAPASLADLSGDLLLAGTGAGDFGCASGDTAGESFAAALSGADGSCRWSRGFGTRTLTAAAPRDAGDVVVAGVCTPAGAGFDPGGATTCTRGLFVAALSGATGATTWLKTSAGAGTVTAVRGLAVAPDGTVAVIGDANGVVSFGGASVDFGTSDRSFAATFGPSGAPGTVIRPAEAPYAPLPDAAAFSACAYDRNGKLWLAGPYLGQPALGGVRFSACRPPSCAAATFLARVEADGHVSSFLPVRASPVGGAAFGGDLVLAATSGSLVHALRFTGAATVGAKPWSTGAAGLGALRIVP